MPSADPGAPSVRPADVERWLAELGLEPLERAERDGIASLGPRARRPPPLRPPRHASSSIPRSRSSSGRTTRRRSATCSASRTASCCAGTTSSRSRSSAWARTSGRCSRSSCRSPRPTRDALGLALARILGIADRLLDESDGLALDRRQACPDQTGRRGRATRRFLARYDEPAAGAPRRDEPASGRPARRRAPAARRSRSSPRSACSRRPRPVAEVRAATPDLTIVERRPLRRPAGPAAGPGHASTLTLTNHLTDTDDQALLLRPGVPRGPARARPAYRAAPGTAAGRRRSRATKRTKDYTLLRLDLAQPAVQRQDRAPTRSASTSSTTGGKATRDLRIGDSLVSFPVWAFAQRRDARAARSTVVFPAGFQVEVEAGVDPGADDRRDGPDDLPDRHARRRR